MPQGAPVLAALALQFLAQQGPAIPVDFRHGLTHFRGRAGHGLGHGEEMLHRLFPGQLGVEEFLFFQGIRQGQHRGAGLFQNSQEGTGQYAHTASVWRKRP